MTEFDGLLTRDNATHYLRCHQCQSRSRITYHMHCHVLKDMGDGRVKIRVFGNRNWNYDLDTSRIRYVDKSRVSKKTKWHASKINYTNSEVTGHPGILGA